MRQNFKSMGDMRVGESSLVGDTMDYICITLKLATKVTVCCTLKMQPQKIHVDK